MVSFRITNLLIYPTVVIEADGSATHQAVVSVMEAAPLSQLGQTDLATRAPAR